MKKQEILPKVLRVEAGLWALNKESRQMRTFRCE